MIFQHPGFLYASTLVLVPIVLHLFHIRRRKKIIFPSTELLQNVSKQQRSSKKLKDLLLLLLRCLALLALVFAFAKPFIPASKNAQLGKNIIVIDNSLSMQANGLIQAGLPLATKLAKDIVHEIKSDNWAILTNNNFLGEFNPLSKQEATSELNTLEATNTSKTLEQQLLTLNSLGLDSTDQVFIIGDWQQNSYSIQKSIKLPKLTLIPVKAVSENNLAIDSVWFNSPIHLSTKTEEISCRVYNYGQENVEDQSLNLSINNIQVGLKPFSIAAEEFTELSFTYQNPDSAIVEGKLTLQDPSVGFDNTYHFAYNTQKQLKVISIGGKDFTKQFQKIVGNDTEYQLKTFTEQQVNASALNAASVCIIEISDDISSGLQDALKQFMANGKVLIVFPKNLEKESFPTITFLSPIDFICRKTSELSLSTLNKKSALVNGIFQRIPKNLNLPNIQEAYSFEPNANANQLIGFSDGSSFALEIINKGRCFIWGTNPTLETNSLKGNALFPAFIYRMLEYGSSAKLQAINPEQSAEFIFNDDVLSENISLENTSQNLKLIPDVKRQGKQYTINVKRFNLNPDLYKLVVNNKHIASLGVNANTNESVFSFYEIDNWTQKAKNLGYDVEILPAELTRFSADLSSLYDGKALWKYFIYFALLCIFIEILLLKLWK